MKMLCALLATLTLSTAAVAADPTDLVGVSKNQAGGFMFFTTYVKAKTGLECPAPWHLIISTTPTDKLLGCWAFAGPDVIMVHWADNTDSKLDATDGIAFTDWFIAKFPAYAHGQSVEQPALPDGKMTPHSNDTQL